MVNKDILINGFSEFFCGSPSLSFDFKSLFIDDFHETKDFCFTLYEDNEAIASVYLLSLSFNSFYVFIKKYKHNIFEYLGYSLHKFTLFLKKHDIYLIDEVMANAF